MSKQHWSLMVRYLVLGRIPSQIDFCSIETPLDISVKCFTRAPPREHAGVKRFARCRSVGDDDENGVSNARRQASARELREISRFDAAESVFAATVCAPTALLSFVQGPSQNASGCCIGSTVRRNQRAKKPFKEEPLRLMDVCLVLRQMAKLGTSTVSSGRYC